MLGIAMLGPACLVACVRACHVFAVCGVQDKDIEEPRQVAVVNSGKLRLRGILALAIHVNGFQVIVSRASCKSTQTI